MECNVLVLLCQSLRGLAGQGSGRWQYKYKVLVGGEQLVING